MSIQRPESANCQFLNEPHFQWLSGAREKGSLQGVNAQWSSYWPLSFVTLLVVLRAALLPTHDVYHFASGDLLFTLLNFMLGTLGLIAVLHVYPWIRPYYHFVLFSSASVLLSGTAIAVWAVLTNAMDSRVIFFFCEPMLICLTLMSFVLQSQDGVEDAFKALEALRGSRTSG